MNNPVFTFEGLYKAYLRCRKNKRSSGNALRFELNAEEELLKLTRELNERTYSPLPSTCFVARSPKPREIFAAEFRDRIVHHFLVSLMEPGWESVFIYDSFACRKRKGVHAGVKRLQSFMRKVSGNRSHPAWFLQIDIKSFFVSINKRILFNILKRRESNPDIVRLLETVIFNDPSVNPDMKGQLSLFDEIPPYKSLFHTGNKTGLPIGNYTSQFFANVYLNELDQFVKHTLKCRYYLRYVDDFILLSYRREELEQWEKSIREFLQRRLNLDLNERRRTLAPVSNGSNFLGYIVRPTHLLVRKRSVNNLKEKLKKFEPRLTGKLPGAKIIRYPSGVLEGLRAVLASYLGQFLHASSFSLIKFIFHDYPYLNRYFMIKKGRLYLPYRPPRFGKLSEQYGWFCRKHRDKLIFFQVGLFYEFYGPQAERAKKYFELKKGPPRPGLGKKTGFPVSCLNQYLQKALGEGEKVVVLRQTGGYCGGVMERHVSTIILPSQPPQSGSKKIVPGFDI